MVEVDYTGAFAKLARAEQHIKEVDFLIYHYLRKREFRISQVFDLEEEKFGFEVSLLKLPPSEISSVLGDALHNLRSVLDLCVTANVIAREGKIESGLFPFAKDSGDSFEKKAKELTKKIGQEAAQVWREAKPYPTGNEALYGLHEADITDKHRSIITTVAYADFRVRYLPTGPTRPVQIDAPIHILSLSPTFVPAPVTKSDEVPSEFGLERQIVFPPDGPLAGYPVVQTLYALLEDVKRIVCNFQRSSSMGLESLA